MAGYDGQVRLGDPKFVPIAIDDVEISAAPAWLIHRLLPARGLACIVGPPKSGKSFLITDALFAVARGAPYGGRATLPGPVIYLTGEGVTGFRRRLVAMRRHYGVEGRGVPFFIIEQMPDLGSERTDVEMLLGDLDRFIAYHHLTSPRAIALDTLARCMRDGDENSTRDMGRFVHRCGRIEHHFGCLVTVVHHIGKDAARGSRGSNALNAAADVFWSVEKNDGFRLVRIDEMKDAAEGQEWRFHLLPYDLSETSRSVSMAGSETSTCIVELLSNPSSPKPISKPAPIAPKGVVGDLLHVLRRAIDEAGEIQIGNGAVPKNTRAVNRGILKTYCGPLGWQNQEEKPNAFRAMLSKSLKDLRKRGFIGMDGPWIWMASP